MIIFLLIWGAVALAVVGAGVASFFVRRHGEDAAPDSSWRRTDEVFNDPSTNRVMRVWLDTKGGRHYVHEDNTRAV